MMRQYRYLIVRECLILRRGFRKFIGIMLVVPLLFSFLFAYAINLDVKHLPTAVFNQSPREESRDLLAAFENSGYFDIWYVAKSQEEISDLIESGRVKAGITIPPDFTNNIKHGRSALVQVIVDDSDFRNVNAAQNVAQLIGQAKAQKILIAKLQSITGAKAASPYEIRVRSWYNMENSAVFSVLPGITSAMLVLTILLSFAMSVISDRQQGLLERFSMLNIKPSLYFGAKAIPYLLGALIQFTILLLVQVKLFSLPFRGNVILLYAFVTIFIVTCLAIAFIIARLSKIHLQAVVYILPIFLLSMLLAGFIGPHSGLAKCLYWLSYAIPMTYFLEIMRGIMLKGVGVMHLWIAATGSLSYCILAVVLAVKSKK